MDYVDCVFSTKESHQTAEANQLKNLALRQAFGISEFYVDGSSFDPNRKAKEEAAKVLAQKKYECVHILEIYLITVYFNPIYCDIDFEYLFSNVHLF